MKSGSYVRIGYKYAQAHKYEYAVGYGAKIYKISSMTEIPYAVVDLVQRPPEGKPHRLLIPTVDLKRISKEQAQFNIIK